MSGSVSCWDSLVVKNFSCVLWTGVKNEAINCVTHRCEIVDLNKGCRTIQVVLVNHHTATDNAIPLTNTRFLRFYADQYRYIESHRIHWYERRILFLTEGKRVRFLWHEVSVPQNSLLHDDTRRRFCERRVSSANFLLFFPHLARVFSVSSYRPNWYLMFGNFSHICTYILLRGRGASEFYDDNCIQCKVQKSTLATSPIRSVRTSRWVVFVNRISMSESSD